MKLNTKGKTLGNQLRAGLMEYFQELEAIEGLRVADLWAELFQAEPVHAMKMAISLAPKEVELENTIEHNLNVNTNNLADAALKELVEAKKRADTDERAGTKLH